MAARPLVMVGISGGVDSAVAALLLREAGHEVQGLHMTNWEVDDAYCTAAADYQSARQVCADLGIPLHRANFSAAYRDQVFSSFLAEYAAGRTPNPDVLCNREIKFGAFLEHARRLGAGMIATGHYARGGATSGGRLLLARDTAKDQTYFLHAVEPSALAVTLFPLGDLTKEEVRSLANRAGLANFDRPDSTGICFIGERPFREFLSGYLSGTPGPILACEGEHLGEHSGLIHYTIGQRSGIGIGGRSSGGDAAWYVVAKDIARNALVVAQGRGHPALWSRVLTTGPPHWLRAIPDPCSLRGLRARIRHRHAPAACEITTAEDGSLRLLFADSQWAVAPGQYAVLYTDDECVGGAVIETAAPV
ncbi:MAG: tRNA 2-thiouridine(34) synthase MnmA [Gammaproteobacteria bacterium]|nr:tRNA 2-thiouridine(34) synthase MnmA [Gammaproteobacteria bacterium]